MAQLALILMVPDYVILGPVLVVFNLGYVGQFMYNIIHAPALGFQVPPALVFMFICSAAAGATGLGLLLI